MIKHILLFTVLLLIINCSKEEINFETYNLEAFAYDLGDSWEVNVSVFAKGFDQKEVDNSYHASLDYSINLILPNGDKIDNIFNDAKEIKQTEEIRDVELEAQFELDSSFEPGIYKLEFILKDRNSDKIVNSTVGLELSE